DRRPGAAHGRRRARARHPCRARRRSGRDGHRAHRQPDRRRFLRLLQSEASPVVTELELVPVLGAETVVAPTVDTRRRSRHRVISYFLRQPIALVAVAFLVLLAFVAVFAPLVAPYNPNKSDLLAIYQPPGHGHLLPTDEIGRGVFSRLIFGARTSLLAGLEALGVSLAIGLLLGLAAGYYGRWLDTTLSRITDALMSVPPLILALAMVAVLGPG